MGNRRNATAPRKNSTTNSTIGVIGWRIAQADIFFTNVLRRRPARGHAPPAAAAPPALDATGLTVSPT